MRKRLISVTAEGTRSHGDCWIDIDASAAVEISSEEKDFPIDSALLKGGRAVGGRRNRELRLSGSYSMRPKSSNTLSWFFEENERKRTQELFCGGLPTADSFREIVRQQLNFSPPETVREAPEYQVELSGVTVLELTIIPEISGGTASASLKNLRVA